MSHQNSNKGLNRRDFIKIGGMSTVALTLGSVGLPSDLLGENTAYAKKHQNAKLKFNQDGKFKVVQFNDTQDDERIDRRTIELMEKVLDSEKPDFVVLNGDNISSGCDTALEMKQAMNNVVQPMEKREIKWAVTFGNHDEDSTPNSGVDEEAMLKFYRSYKYNCNEPGEKNLTGTGNMNLLIKNSKGNKAAFNLWLLDSGRYAPKSIAGQSFEGYPTWDWLRFNQVNWYYETSKKIEKESGKKIPSLVFIHIPLWEHRNMWFASVDERTDANHAVALERHSIVGERNEDECPGPVNSGLFSAMLERGDVKGVFCGHDHINTYAGNYYGIMLGYGGNTGFGTYGLPGAERNRLRGARVFNLDENTEDVLVDTHMVFAKEYGIDLTANDQSIDPLPLEDNKGKVRS
ncbi:3',5'-cyclic AMP phosphodiesterase CpdA [Bacillus pakistanensis]|uniref:3',5'-cyclic AMP phosphodiesterase CpdA n=1 Tax=Rossellomorea pakistanensis TaxID=992288 RepID=A0ABS2NCS1_9BACI|nr:metallophosphoesterase family protein [Bacillus pakistanensis]MBM7585630.1 3',5'-cyclic AMP phosphodiesterase CpdA [Bacillus pakistanensis]